MFNIMEIQSQYIEVRTKEQFVGMIGVNPFNVVHITTHGHVAETKGTEKFVGFWTPDGTVALQDLAKPALRGKTVVSTACMSGTTTFARSLVKQTSVRCYIAPKESPRFHNSIYFAHWFYHNIFILKLSPLEAVKKYNGGYKNPHDFTILTGT